MLPGENSTAIDQARAFMHPCRSRSLTGALYSAGISIFTKGFLPFCRVALTGAAAEISAPDGVLACFEPDFI